MALEDTLCTLVPYFLVAEGQLDAFKALGEQMVEKTRGEDEVVFYGFSFAGRRAHFREGYRSAQGILAHLENVGELLGKVLEISELERLEVHAPAAAVAELETPMKQLDPTFFVMESGFRRG